VRKGFAFPVDRLFFFAASPPLIVFRQRSRTGLLKLCGKAAFLSKMQII